MPEATTLPLRAPTRGATLLERIGNTPLLRLTRLAAGLPEGVELYARAEHLNPSGSLKDRPVLAMVRAAEASGALVPGREILDATSGNGGMVRSLAIT